MRYGTYFPALAGCFALMLLATASRTVGQGSVRITDESAPTAPVTVETPSTTVTVKTGEATEAAPAAEAPAQPAQPPEVKINQTAVLNELSKLESQADQALANQQKIDASLKVLSETIEQARIYASRAGRNNATP